MFVRPEEDEPMTNPAPAVAALTALATVPVAPVPVVTVAPEPSTAHTTETIKIEYGHWIADFANKSEPIAAMLLMAIWTHFAPALLRMIVPTSVIESAVNKVFSAGSLFIQNQSVAVSIPMGFLADAMHNILIDVPELITWIESEVDPIILTQMKAMGVIPV